MTEPVASWGQPISWLGWVAEFVRLTYGQTQVKSSPISMREFGLLIRIVLVGQRARLNS